MHFGLSCSPKNIKEIPPNPNPAPPRVCLRLSKSRGKRSRNSPFCAAFKTKDAPVKRGGSEYQAHTSVKGEASLLSPRQSAGEGIHKLIKNCSVLIELFLLASHLPIKRLGMAGGNSYFFPKQLRHVLQAVSLAFYPRQQRK